MSLQSKGLSRAFSKYTVVSINSLALSLLYGPTPTSVHAYWKNHESHSAVSNSLQSRGLYSPWNSPGKNIGVGSLSLLQRIYPTHGLNPGLPHCRRILYQRSHKGSPRLLEWVAYPFSSRSSPPRNRTRLSCTAAGFFTK